MQLAHESPSPGGQAHRGWPPAPVAAHVAARVAARGRGRVRRRRLPGAVERVQRDGRVQGRMVMPSFRLFTPALAPALAVVLSGLLLAPASAARADEYEGRVDGGTSRGGKHGDPFAPDTRSRLTG